MLLACFAAGCGTSSGSAGGPPQATVAGCTAYGVYAIEHHITVTRTPAPCQGLSKAEINQAAARAIIQVAGGVRKAIWRKRAAEAAPFLAHLFTTPPPVTSSLPGPRRPGPAASRAARRQRPRDGPRRAHRLAGHGGQRCVRAGQLDLSRRQPAAGAPGGTGLPACGDARTLRPGPGRAGDLARFTWSPAGPRWPGPPSACSCRWPGSAWPRWPSACPGLPSLSGLPDARSPPSRAAPASPHRPAGAGGAAPAAPTAGTTRVSSREPTARPAPHVRPGRRRPRAARRHHDAPGPTGRARRVSR